MASHHDWLIDVARGHTTPQSGELPEELGGSIAESWEQVAAALAVSEEELARYVGEHFKVETADLKKATASATRLIPEKMARRYGMIPLELREKGLVLAVSDPTDGGAIEAAEFYSGRSVIPAVATPKMIEYRITSAFAPARDVTPAAEGERFDREADSVAASGIGAGRPNVAGISEADSAVVRLVDTLLREAARQEASDIHVQPHVGGGLVRFRIDGILRRGVSFPREVVDHVIRRVKVMGGMDITLEHVPQDGRAALTLEEAQYDLRISTLPAQGGSGSSSGFSTSRGFTPWRSWATPRGSSRRSPASPGTGRG